MLINQDFHYLLNYLICLYLKIQFLKQYFKQIAFDKKLDVKRVELKKVIVEVILFVLGFSYEDLKSTLTLLGTIFIVLPTLISIIVVIISITKSPKLIDLEQECTKKLEEFFEVQNQQYRKKGLQ